jgi:response regulator of citrate/malate metabolism
MDSIKLSFNTPKLKNLNSVFIIEDNPMESNMLIDYLSKYPNVVVKSFTSGDACIKEIVMSKISPDLILLDYFLDSTDASSKDGLEILAKLREITPYSEFIMLTSVDNERIIELARKKGAMGYIIKGISGYVKLDEMLKKIFALEPAPEPNTNEED